MTYIDVLKILNLFCLVFRFLSSFKRTVLKQKKKKEVVGFLGDLFTDCCECLGFVHDSIELEKFKYVFWRDLGLHYIRQRVSSGGSTPRWDHGSLQDSLAGFSGHRQRDAKAAR